MRKDALNFAKFYASQKGVLRKESGITQSWWRSFRDGQADLSLKRGDGTAHILWMQLMKKLSVITSGCNAEKWYNEFPRVNLQG